MNIIYECPICYRQFRDRAQCQRCAELHKTDILAQQISLSYRDFEYHFSSIRLRLKHGQTINTEIQCYGLYDAYPHFSVECCDNPDEVIAAKKALLRRAMEWTDAYRLKVEKMLEELKHERDK